MSASDRVLATIARKALDATGASGASVLARGDDTDLRVVVSVRGGAQRAPGASVPADDLGFVLAAGQPLSLVRKEAGPLLAAACTDGQTVHGVLELTRSPGGEPFAADATPLVALLAEIAGTAMAEGAGEEAAPTPAELAAELGRLQQADPARYAAVSTAVGALLSHG